ncbi:MAG: hypothetical protein RBS56_01175 [Candidatus Gracilibacteria bacterium]|jgi:hypothetical protein|nr:hypothetical protein [Candidatus Gracilibacteria bacterium]
MPYQSVDETIAQKTDRKKRLFGFLKLSNTKKRPLISIIADKELSQAQVSVLRQFNEATSSLNADFLILSDSALDGLSNFHFIEFNLGNREMVLEASDLIIAYDFNDLEEVFMQGCVPICKEREGAQNYNAQEESGNSFIIKNDSVYGLFEATVRAIETFKFPWDFKHIVRTGMKIQK